MLTPHRIIFIDMIVAGQSLATAGGHELDDDLLTLVERMQRASRAETLVVAVYTDLHSIGAGFGASGPASIVAVARTVDDLRDGLFVVLAPRAGQADSAVLARAREVRPVDALRQASVDDIERIFRTDRQARQATQMEHCSARLTGMNKSDIGTHLPTPRGDPT